MPIHLENLIREIRSLPLADKRRVQRALSEDLSGETSDGSRAGREEEVTDEEYQQRLVGAGLLKHVRPRRCDQDAFERFQPVEIAGKPLSETIVEERR